MRLCPLDILNQLPRQQLLGQHRECCALRGKGWGRKHATVNYVFKHPYAWLWHYHVKVMREMVRRNYKFDFQWGFREYRGKTLGVDWTWFTKEGIEPCDVETIYPEHDADYLAECIENLARKGVKIEISKKESVA